MRTPTLSILAAIVLSILLPSEASAHQADRALRYGRQVCDALAGTANANPNHLRSARSTMETLASARRDYDRITRDAQRAHDKASSAQSKFRTLEVKLAKDCKGKRGPMCLLTRKRADMAKKKFDRLVAKFHQLDKRRRASERSLNQKSAAAMNAFRRLAKYAKRR